MRGTRTIDHGGPQPGLWVCLSLVRLPGAKGAIGRTGALLCQSGSYQQTLYGTIRKGDYGNCDQCKPISRQWRWHHKGTQ